MRIFFLLILTSMLFLIGCGSDGESDPPPVEPPIEPTPTNVMPPIEKPGAGGGPYSLYSGSLKAIDLSDPTKTYLIANIDNFEGEVLVTGEMNSGGTAIINLKEDRAIYHHNNKFWKLNLNQNSDLVAHQLTNFAGSICNFEISGNDFDLDASQLIFQVAGMDDTCFSGNDDQILMTRLDASSSSEPINITTKLNSVAHRRYIPNIVDPAITDKILVVNDMQLVLHSVDFSGTGEVKLTATSSMEFLDADGVANSDGVFLEADGNIYYYNYAANSVGIALHNVPSGYSIAHIHDERMHCNSSECVFAEQSNSSSDFTIFKIAIDGSASSVPLASSPSSILRLNDIRVTNTVAYLVLKNTTTTGSEMKAVALSGGQLYNIVEGDDLPFWTMENYLYYSVTTELPNNRLNFTAYALQDNSSTPTEYSNSLWIGGAATELVVGEMQEPNKILLAYNYTSDDTRLDGATLRVFDSKTHTETGPNVGVVTGTDIIVGEITGVGDKIIGVIATTPDPEIFSDLVYTDLSQADSYRRITSDDTAQEEPISIFFSY